MPQGVAGTDRWLREIGKLTGKQDAAEALIKKEHRRISARLKAVREKLAGKRLYVSAGQARAVTLAESAAAEYGMEILGITLFHYDDVIKENIERLAKGREDFVVNVSNIQHFEQANLLNRLQPDLILAEGATATWAAIQGFAVAAIFDLGRTYQGYEGSIQLGERIADALKNPSFGKGLSRWAKLPYRASWYDQSPFKYITEKPEPGPEPELSFDSGPELKLAKEVS